MNHDFFNKLFKIALKDKDVEDVIESTIHLNIVIYVFLVI